MRSTDGTLALISARLALDGDALQKRAGEIAAELSGTTPDGVLDVRVGGAPVTFDAVGTHDREGPRPGGGHRRAYHHAAAPAGLRHARGRRPARDHRSRGSVVGSFASLWVITQFTDVSIFAINLVTALGIGLGIDYALFMVTRFREELARGHEHREAAVRRTVRTAGRTVVYSGITVAISLAALLVFPQFFLRSFAYAGIATVGLAVIAAVVILPAALAALGPRVNRFRVLKSTTEIPEDGFWFRLSSRSCAARGPSSSAVSPCSSRWASPSCA